MKHAYLVIANNNPRQLQMLLTLIDDSRNDIYLMIDKKSNNMLNKSFNTNYSVINYVKPINIYWGSYSLVQAEMILFESAAPENYGYYHLLSGYDLPLANQDSIHNFLDKRPNKEFIQYQKDSRDRIIWKPQPHLFQKHFSNNYFCSKFTHLENHIYKHIHPHKLSINKLSLASEWLTIDNSLTHLIVNNRSWIRHNFWRGILIDEVFIPTLINYHPKFINKINDTHIYKGIYNSPQSNLRYIKKLPTGAHPLTFTIKDYKELLKARNKGFLFARKFNSRKDIKIIKKLFNSIMNS